MKKFNLKELNQEKLKELAILHVEKVVFGLFVGVFVWFVWNASEASVYDRTPQDLSAGANNVRQHVNNSSWERFMEFSGQDPNQFVPKLPDEPYPTQALNNLKPPNVSLYNSSVPWYGPVIPPKAKRAAPELFAVEDLKVRYGYGPFAIRDTNASAQQPAGENTKGPPKGRQARGAEAFLKAASGARPPVGRPPAGGRTRGEEGPGFDPAMALERGGMEDGFQFQDGAFGVQVTEGVKVKGRRWIVLTGAVPFFKQQNEFFDALRSTPATVKPQDYVQYFGPFIERAEVIKGKVQNWAPVQTEHLRAEIESWDANPLEPVDASVLNPRLCLPLPPLVGRGWDPRSVVHPRIPLLKEEALKQKAEAALKDDKVDAAAQAGMAQAGIFVWDPKPKRETGSEMGLPQEMGRIGPGAAIIKDQEYHLFRFFDFTVEPGKTYQYRVKLIINNPNFGLTAKELADVKFAEKEFLETPESNVSEPVSVEFDSHLLAGAAKAGPSGREGTANVMVRQWDHDLGVNAVWTFDAYRGQVTNYTSVKVPVVDPLTGKTNEKPVDFKTNLMLVDFQGGDRLRPRTRIPEPADMLFVKPDGTLLVKHELGDLLDYREENERLELMGKPAEAPKNPNDNYFDLLNPGEESAPPPRGNKGRARE